MRKKLMFMMIVALLSVVSAEPHAQPATDTGGTGSALKSPCVVETVFVPADPKVSRHGQWVSGQAYLDLGKFTCDGLSLRRNFRKRDGTWEPGLEMYTRPLRNGKIKLEVRATLNNPRHNHDKVVKITLEVIERDKIVQALTVGPVSLEDNGNDVAESATVQIPEGLLKSTPLPKLRVTMIVLND